jgi:Flp pilus assembly protein TadD
MKDFYSEEEIQELIKHLEKHPEDSEKWFLLGVAQLSRKWYTASEKAFKKCLKLDKNHALALGELGGISILREKPKDAVKYLKKCVKIRSDKHEYWSQLGVAYMMAHKLKDAVDAFRTSLAINPKYLDALVSLGMTYNLMKDWRNVITTLNEALLLSPEDVEVLKGIARAQMKLKRTEELEKTYLRIHELDPYDHSLLLYLGQIAFDNNRRKEGLDYYQKAVEMAPNSLMAWKVLAEALDKLGKADEAKKAWANYKDILEQIKKDKGIFGTI